MPCHSSLPKPRSSVMWCCCDDGLCANARRNRSLSSGARCFAASINASMFCVDMPAFLLSTQLIGASFAVIADLFENVAKEIIECLIVQAAFSNLPASRGQQFID